MKIKSFDDIRPFIVFFIPGFIMMKTYSLLIARDTVDFSKAVLEAIAFSCLNYAICMPILYLMVHYNLYTEYLWLYIIVMFIIMLVAPVLEVKACISILNSKWAAKNRLLDPQKSAWDFVFSKGGAYWVLITLKNGQTIAGQYKDGSYASSYPNKDIFLSEIWKFENRTFIKKHDRTTGILILGDDISLIEFIE